MKILTVFLVILTSVFTIFAQGETADPVSRSALTQIGLPDGAYLLREENIPVEYQKLFAEYIKLNPSFRQGSSEFLVLTNAGSKKTNPAKLRGAVENSLRTSGWEYNINPPENGVAFFMAVKKMPVRQTVFGYWVPVNDSLILAMTELLSSQKAADAANSANPAQNKRSNNISNRDSNDIKEFNLSATEQNVNVMGSQMPPMPTFPALPKKKGKIRGYVKDLSGNFLKGAAIALGSIRIGYSRLVSETVTDAKGFYELDLPLNSGKFHYASYAIDYGAGRAAMALHPVDGDLNDNPPGEGGVENFVLLPYGIADKSSLAENSNYSSSFYGGAIALFINMGYPGADISINRGSFDPGSQIKITLTPLGNLIDASSSKTFVINKNLDENTRNEFFINNIPVGKYRLTIQTGGRPVGLRQRLPENSIYGIQPTETRSGEATILFYPRSGKPSEIGAGSGGWHQVEIYLEAPDK